MNETPLQMARRHMAEGQSRMDAQIAHLTEARRLGDRVELAKEILQMMQTSQKLFRVDLPLLKAKQK